NDESAKAAIAAIEKQKLAEQCTLAPSPKAWWDAFTEILVKNPNDFAAHYQRGLAAASAGTGAVIDFAIAVNIDPKSWPARFNLGTAYATEQKFDLAVEQFNRAIELYPKLAQAYYARGVTLSKLKKPDEAIADHSKAIELNPKLLLCEPRESL
ncbi:MAG TPA: tetratricopeptide repeat protein, partial [Methyloceanibacter sp.]